MEGLLWGLIREKQAHLADNPSVLAYGQSSSPYTGEPGWSAQAIQSLPLKGKVARPQAETDEVV